MSNLKVKLNLFEKRLAMQVIAQSEDITGTLSNPKKFTASNGFEIISSQYPSFPVDPDNSVGLRGEEADRDLDVAIREFGSNEDAVEYFKSTKQALCEFVNNLRLNKVNSLLESQDIIDLGSCKLLVRYIIGGFVIQLLSSNIQKSSANVFESRQFGIKVGLDGCVEIYLPFCTSTKDQVIVMTEKVEAETSMTSKDIVRNILYSLSLLNENNPEVSYSEFVIDY